MDFASDNTAGMAPAILNALARANTGYALGYGNDAWTKRVEQRFAEIFEREVAVFLVPTGTVANALALAHGVEARIRLARELAVHLDEVVAGALLLHDCALDFLRCGDERLVYVGANAVDARPENPPLLVDSLPARTSPRQAQQQDNYCQNAFHDNVTARHPALLKQNEGHKRRRF